MAKKYEVRFQVFNEDLSSDEPAYTWHRVRSLAPTIDGGAIYSHAEGIDTFDHLPRYVTAGWWREVAE